LPKALGFSFVGRERYWVFSGGNKLMGKYKPGKARGGGMVMAVYIDSR